MSVSVACVRWLNRVLPLHALKPSLARRVEPLVVSSIPQVYTGLTGGLRMRLDLALRYERAIYLNARDSVLLALVRRILRPGDTAIDCGANLGLVTLVAARRVGPRGRVHAFEPAPAIVARLRENLVLNRLENVTVHPCAVWNARTTATLHGFAGMSHDNDSLARAGDASVERSTPVECAPLDEVLPGGAVRLLKLDVEGAEWPALRGAERLLSEGPARPHLILEANPAATRPFGYHPLDCIEWLVARRPDDRLHLMRPRRRQRVTLAMLRDYLRGDVRKAPSVWFEPPGGDGRR